jgi:RNA polymerase sigma factor (sigma-70 family)
LLAAIILHAGRGEGFPGAAPGQGGHGQLDARDASIGRRSGHQGSSGRDRATSVDESSLKSIQVQNSIDRVKAGDPAARDELIGCCCDRLDLLIMKMLGRYEEVKRSEHVDDVVQRVTMRLYRSLEPVALESSRDFLRLASVQIRRELLDLVAHFFSPDDSSTGDAGSSRPDAPQDGDTVAGVPMGAFDATRLSKWIGFHRQIERLEDEDRELFELLWYQGLTQPETADLLGISRGTMIRRWQGARLRLFDALNGQLPPSD